MTKAELKELYQKAYDSFEEEVKVYDYIYKRPTPPPIETIDNYLIEDEDDRHFPQLPFNHKYTEEEIQREDYRRKNGYFFFTGFNKSLVLEYVTGDHYMMLQHFPLDTVINGRPSLGHANFRDSHRDVQYVWDLAKKDPDCMGILFYTYRRFGKTIIAGNNGYWDTTGHKDSRMWIQARDNDESKEKYEEVLKAYGDMNPIWKPDNARITKEQTYFGTYASQTDDDSVSLRSIIKPFAAYDKELDGKIATYIWQDEVGKIEKPNSWVERWEVTKWCLTIGRDIVGKCFAVTTVEEMEDGGGKEAKQIWDESNYNIKENGRTVSGLYRLFIPASFGFTGFMDKYGYSDVKGAEEYHRKEMEKLSDTGKLGYRRRFPLKEEDMFIKKNTDSLISLHNLYRQRDFNDDLPEGFVRRGNFVWQQGMKDTKVIWVPDPNGRWEIANWMPDSTDTSRWQTLGNQRKPAGNMECFTGIDPIDNKLTSDSKYSYPAAMTFRKFNPMEPAHSDMFICKYMHRPPFPEIFWEDMIMQAVFFNSPVLVESNKIGLINYFRMRGYYEYLLERPESTHTDWSKKHQKEKGVPMTGDAPRAALVEAWMAYVANHVGYDYEQNTHGKLYFNDVIEQLIEFRPEERWTDWDLVVAGGLALIASTAKQSHRKMLKIGDFVKNYGTGKQDMHYPR